MIRANADPGDRVVSDREFRWLTAHHHDVWPACGPWVACDLAAVRDFDTYVSTNRFAAMDKTTIASCRYFGLAQERLWPVRLLAAPLLLPDRSSRPGHRFGLLTMSYARCLNMRKSNALNFLSERQ